MHPLRLLLGCLAVSATVGLGSLRAAQTSPIPLESFFAEPDIRAAEISPDGKYIAFLTTLGTGRVGIALIDLETKKVEPLAAPTDDNYRFLFWKGPDFLVFGGDIGGNESYALRSMNVKTRRIFEIGDAYIERVQTRVAQSGIVDRLKFDPNHILIYGNKERGSYNYAYWLLDVRNGKREAFRYDRPEDTGSPVVDCAGKVRARSRFSGEDVLFETTDGDSGLFKAIKSFKISAEVNWGPVGFSADNQTLYLVTDDTTDTSSLQALDLASGRIGPVLFNEPHGEIESVLFSDDHTKLYGVAYNTDRLHYHWFDEGRAKLQEMIDGALPGAFNTVVSQTPDEQLLVIHSGSDRNPGMYYLLNRKKGSLEAILPVLHTINPAQMQPMQSITYQSRDGLDIHGYLTLPANAQGHRVPLILNPHGGPYGIRDDWGFDPEVQFLASRGYAVLQVNYRGSGGYGRHFAEAGKHEWGLKMQDDLTDAVRWAIDQGIADPKRVIIYGASYGGYAALAGVTFTPDLYCCGINYVGVSDLAIINRGTFFGGRGTKQFYADWVGDDSKSMHDRSPVHFVENIRVPTFHAYGDNDPRVELANWKRLKAQLDKYHKPYEFMRLEDEGHGFRKESNRIAFYRRLETFLGEHVPAASPGPAPAASQ